MNKEGRIVPRGERGDLLIRGYSVMYGYWDSEDSVGKDRWYRTG